jgi:hypothetical protein
VVAKANHQILSNWLKRATSLGWCIFGLLIGGAIVWYRGRRKEDAHLLDKALAEQHRKRMKNK